MINALGRRMNCFSGTREVHEFTGRFASFILGVITVNGETNVLGTLEQAVLLWRIRKHKLALWIWLSRSRLRVLDIIQL